MLCLRPAEAVYISSDVSIGRCIELMQTIPSSYVLIKNRHGQLSGIFTDHDLRKKFQIVRQEKNLSRPISLLMRRPVKVMPVSQIHKSLEFMVKHELRYVPIVESLQRSRKNLLGIVSLEQLAKQRLRGEAAFSRYLKQKKQKSVTVGLLSPDGSSFFKMKKMFSPMPKFYVDRLWMGKTQSESAMTNAAKKYDLVLFDIDEAPKEEWLRLARFFNGRQELKKFGILYDPQSHDKGLIKVLRQLKVAGQFFVYTKPMDLSLLMTDFLDV